MVSVGVTQSVMLRQVRLAQSESLEVVGGEGKMGSHSITYSGSLVGSLLFTLSEK